jgi:hypothetical protein
MSSNPLVKAGFVLLIVFIAVVAGTAAAVSLFALILRLSHFV